MKELYHVCVALAF